MRTITLKNNPEKEEPPMLMPEPTVGNQHHTLFKQEVDEKVQVEVVAYTPGHVNHVVYIGEFSEMNNGLHKMFHELRQADNEKDKIELRISSHGGFVTEGAQFYNLIREVFKDRCTTYLDAHGYSMGALLFCIGDAERVIYETSSLMFHDYSSGAIGKANEIISSIQFSAKHIRAFFKKVIVTPGFLSEEEFQQMTEGKDYWMDSIELCKRKIATHVIVDGEKVTAEEYLDICAGKKPKKVAKKKDADKQSDDSDVKLPNGKSLEDLSDEDLISLMQVVEGLPKKAAKPRIKKKA